ncbi:unnamed protein product [Arabis nemorensis]|uniref:Uncharacterized protein n=1 Tax=Arabis nemorensis TaxID=586526 RepID=A0A565BM92_9BRAS|nr:unnamed protein product [Arabis nemorensis]
MPVKKGFQIYVSRQVQTYVSRQVHIYVRQMAWVPKSNKVAPEKQENEASIGTKLVAHNTLEFE